MLQLLVARKSFALLVALCAACLLAAGVTGCGGGGLVGELGLTTISSFSPSSGTTGAVVTVNGSNLGGTGALVIIHGVVIGGVTGNDSSIQFAIPATVPTGGDTITVNGITAGVFTKS